MIRCINIQYSCYLLKYISALQQSVTPAHHCNFTRIVSQLRSAGVFVFGPCRYAITERQAAVSTSAVCGFVTAGDCQPTDVCSLCRRSRCQSEQRQSKRPADDRRLIIIYYNIMSDYQAYGEQTKQVRFRSIAQVTIFYSDCSFSETVSSTLRISHRIPVVTFHHCTLSPNAL